MKQLKKEIRESKKRAEKAQAKVEDTEMTEEQKGYYSNEIIEKNSRFSSYIQ